MTPKTGETCQSKMISSVRYCGHSKNRLAWMALVDISLARQLRLLILLPLSSNALASTARQRAWISPAYTGRVGDAPYKSRRNIGATTLRGYP